MASIVTIRPGPERLKYKARPPQALECCRREEGVLTPDDVGPRIPIVLHRLGSFGRLCACDNVLSRNPVTTVGKKRAKTRKPIPQCLAMVLCDQIITDRETGKHVIVGTFSRIVVGALPATHPAMWVFVALTEGRGRYNGEIRLTHAETEQMLFKAEGPLDFDDPLQVLEIGMAVPPLRFQHAGRYDFEFRVDGELLLGRKFLVQLHKEKQP